MDGQEESGYTNDRNTSDDDLFRDLDPMLQGGLYKVVFNRQCVLQLKNIDDKGKLFGKRQSYGIRMMTNISIQSYTQIKIEITSELDLFFIYECRVNEKKFERLKKMQGLNLNFGSFLAMMIKQLGLCEKQPDRYQSVFYLNKRPFYLSILQNIDHKSIQLLTLDFELIELEIRKQCLSYRFGLLRTKNERVQNRTREMLALLKLKNPNLLQSMTGGKINTSKNLLRGSKMSNR